MDKQKEDLSEGAFLTPITQVRYADDLLLNTQLQLGVVDAVGSPVKSLSPAFQTPH